MTRPILSVSDLTVTYGGVTAVDRVSLEVEPGAFVGLIGPNGAGKTSLIDAVTGFASYAGHVLVNGVQVDGAPPHKRLRMGLTRTFQGGELFGDMTVRDNILIGSYRGSLGKAAAEIVRGHRSRDPEHVAEAMELFGLTVYADVEARRLSTGHQKLVSVARAVATAPKVVLLDEPAAGLDSTESKVLGSQLQQLQGLGATVVLVDHDMDLIWDVCEVVHVLDSGVQIASGTAEELRRDGRVHDAYLGAARIVEEC